MELHLRFVLAPQLSRAADGPTEALLPPEAIYAGNDWIADRKLTIIEGDAAAAETAWRALGGAGAFEVLHKEQYTAGFKPTNEKMSFNSEKFPAWASTAAAPSPSAGASRSVARRQEHAAQERRCENRGHWAGPDRDQGTIYCDGLCGNQPGALDARQFFTKSFLGDDAAILARSSGEEPASPRHRAGAATMAWRTTR